MKELSFDTGVVAYNINGKCEVSFNPTDSSFVERLYNTFEELDRKQELYRETVQKMADKREIFRFARERDEEMRGILDGIFEMPVSDALFGGMCTYAMAQGLPIWANFILSIMDELDDAFSREQKATNPKLQKYLAKYKK